MLERVRSGGFEHLELASHRSQSKRPPHPTPSRNGLGCSRGQHTGRPPEDLSEDQLEEAMDDLGIEDQELTDADRAAIEAEAE
jgi:hypothetical protein